MCTSWCQRFIFTSVVNVQTMLVHSAKVNDDCVSHDCLSCCRWGFSESPPHPPIIGFSRHPLITLSYHKVTKDQVPSPVSSFSSSPGTSHAFHSASVSLPSL